MSSMWATEESGSGTSAELVLGCNNVGTSLWAGAGSGTSVNLCSKGDAKRPKCPPLKWAAVLLRMVDAELWRRNH